MLRLMRDKMKTKLEERKLWTTKDGKILQISQMTKRHIKDCLKMLKNQNKMGLKETISYIISSREYEMLSDNAQLAFDHSQEIAFNKLPSKWIDIFEEELKRRKNE